MSVVSDPKNGIVKALEMIERKKLANRKYYMKQQYKRGGVNTQSREAND